MPSPGLPFSYHRLNEDGSIGWKRWRRRRVPRIVWRLRLRVPGLLRRLLRNKARSVCLATRKVVRRLKEGRPYLGELFAGNYMFMQVCPEATSMDKSFLASYRRYYLDLQQLHVHASSKINLPRIVS